MATVAHLAAGALCGAVYARKTSANPAIAVPLFAALAAAPDLDFVAVYRFGADGTPLEHRAATHALPMAVIAGAALGGAFGRGPHRGWAMLVAVVAVASHGIMDAMTTNASGPQLWWPLSSAHISFPWQPIPGTLHWQDYFTSVGLPVLLVESLLSLPLVGLAAWVIFRAGSGEGARPRAVREMADGALSTD